jgi:hypothetical protein
MNLNLQLIPRVLWCVVSATAYAFVTNVYWQSAMLLLPYPFQWLGWSPWWLFWDGHVVAAFWLVAAWLLLCAVAVATGVRRKSRLAGLEEVDIFTAHRYLGLLGDEQQGWTPQFLVDKWPKWAPLWLVAFSCCAWRNKLRNLPFLPSLQWLHRPDPDALPIFDLWTIGGVRFELHWRGWLTELRASKGKWFLDIGPRLDQPDAWGGVSWAFRPFGRL